MKQDREPGYEGGASQGDDQSTPHADTDRGADFIRGALRYDDESGNWYVGEVNVTPYLARYRDQDVMIVIAPLGKVSTPEEPRLVCEICGCGLDEMGDCPHCQLHFMQNAWQRRERVQRERLFAEIDRIVEERWRD
jgi:hypothetical protein